MWQCNIMTSCIPVPSIVSASEAIIDQLNHGNAIEWSTHHSPCLALRSSHPNTGRSMTKGSRLHGCSRTNPWAGTWFQLWSKVGESVMGYDGPPISRFYLTRLLPALPPPHSIIPSFNSFSYTEYHVIQSWLPAAIFIMDKLSGLASKFTGKSESGEQPSSSTQDSSSGSSSGDQRDYLDKGVFYLPALCPEST